MAIQNRRGLESDFDPSKMLPGEWAVSTDTKYVRMCFAPGIVLRMATYESFEMDKAQIKDILENCKTIEAAIIRIQTEVNEKANITVEYAKDALNAANKAEEHARNAKTYADNASAVTGVTIATKDRAGLVKGGENSIAEDGTLELTRNTTERTLSNSYAGGLNIKCINGNSVQNGIPTPDEPVEIKSVINDVGLIIKVSGEEGMQVLRIRLSEPLRKCDKIVKQDGVWGVERNTKVVPFSGTWSKRTEYELPIELYSSADFITDNIKGTSIYMASTHMIFGGAVTGIAEVAELAQNGYFYKYGVSATSGTGTSTYICLNVSIPEELNDALADAVFEYELAIPTFEPFDTDTQIAINSLMTYDAVTYVSTDSEIEPVIEVEYGTSRVGAYSLEALNTANRNEILINELMTLTNSISTAMVEREE